MLDDETRFNLIKRNTAEIVQEDELKQLLAEKESPVVYLGTATTGRPHIAYFSWILKLKDFMDAGFRAKVLIADIHGALDNTPWELVEKRFEYYKLVIELMLEAIGGSLNNIEIIRGSDYQLDKKYIFDMLKLSTLVSVHDAKKASSEVVKQTENPKISGLIYPLMQALDEEYLGVDVQLGGTDQRKILMLAREYLPKMGYKARVEVMYPLIPGLTGAKMSASVPNSKIDLIDDNDTVIKKINKAICSEGVVNDNGILALVKYTLMPLHQDFERPFVVERPDKFGGNVEYYSYDQLEKDFEDKKLHPMDLKQAVAREFNILLDKIRPKIPMELVKAAYPDDF